MVRAPPTASNERICGFMRAFVPHFLLLRRRNPAVAPSSTRRSPKRVFRKRFSTLFRKGCLFPRRPSRPTVAKLAAQILPEAGPQSDRFEDTPHPRETYCLFGHTEAEKQLLGSYLRGRLAHAFIIGGPPGIGKATLAWRFARFLLTNPDPARSEERRVGKECSAEWWW